MGREAIPATHSENPEILAFTRICAQLAALFATGDGRQSVGQGQGTVRAPGLQRRFSNLRNFPGGRSRTFRKAPTLVRTQSLSRKDLEWKVSRTSSPAYAERRFRYPGWAEPPDSPRSKTADSLERSGQLRCRFPGCPVHGKRPGEGRHGHIGRSSAIGDGFDDEARGAKEANVPCR